MQMYQLLYFFLGLSHYPLSAHSLTVPWNHLAFLLRNRFPVFTFASGQRLELTDTTSGFDGVCVCVCVCVCVKRRASSAPFVGILSMALVGFRNISVERSSSIGRWEEEQTKPLSQLYSLLNGMCSASEPVVTPDQFHPLTGMKLVTKDAGTRMILRQCHGNGCESLKFNFDIKLFGAACMCLTIV